MALLQSKRCFIGDEAGGIAPAFAVFSTVIILSIGSGVDIGRWLNARTQTRTAIDSAVIAGARTLQTSTGNTAAAVSVANGFYRENTRTRLALSADSIEFVVRDAGTRLQARGYARIATPFLGLAGIVSLPVADVTGADASAAVIGAGPNAQTSLEIALALATPSSMAGAKLDALKAAAGEFVRLVVWADQGQVTSRVAVVPFASGVNAGSFGGAIRGAVAARTCGAPGCLFYRFAVRGGGYSTNRESPCFAERAGANAYTDAPPSVAMPAIAYASTGGSCDPGHSTLLPLSSDWSQISVSLSALESAGAISGQVGLAWSWYALAPSWGDIWGASRQGRPYEDLNMVAPNGEPVLRKIVVLVADGATTVQHCNGVDDLSIACNAPNGASAVQAAWLCTQMKGAGLTIFSIAFGGSGAESDWLKSCASSDGFFYEAADASALSQAFRDVALKITSLHLSQ